MVGEKMYTDIITAIIKNYTILLILVLSVSPINSQNLQEKIAIIDSLNNGQYLNTLSPSEMKGASEKAIELSQKINDKTRLADSKSNLGTYYLQRGEYDEALALFHEAGRLAVELDSTALQAQNNYFIGNTHSYMGNQEKSLEFVLKAKDLYEKLGDKVWLGKVYNQLGAVYSRLGDRETSAKEFGKSAAIFESLGNTRYMLTPLFNQGMVHYNLNQWEQAVPIFEKCLETSRELGVGKVEMDALYGLGAVSNLRGDYNLALNYLQESLKLSEQYQLPYNIQDNYEGLSEVYAGLGDYENAYNFALKFYNLRDTLTGKETKEQINELQIKYDTELKERQITEKDKALLLAKNETFIRNVLICSLIFLLGMGVLAFSQYRGKMKRQKELTQAQLKNIQLEKENMRSDLAKKEMEVSFKNKELSKLGLHLADKGAFLEKMALKIEKLKKEPQKDNFDKLLREIQIRQEFNKELESFKIYIDENNQDFALKLDVFNLTSGEQRLASLLRLNFTTKDIAVLNNVTVGSVRLAKHRLRKKLQLDENQELIAYLQQV